MFHNLLFVMLENIANQPVNKTFSTKESCILKLEEGK